MLSNLEYERAQKYASCAVREQFIKTRGVLRTLLSIRTGIAPDRLKISENESKPRLLNVEDSHFSVSRRGGLIAVAVDFFPLGVDAEVIDSSANNEDVINTFFHVDERHHVNALSGQARAHAFYEIWARKEAFSKAVGLGMALDFSTFSVVSEGGRVTTDNSSIAAGTWYTQLVKTGPEFCLAIASQQKNPVIETTNWPLTQ